MRRALWTLCCLAMLGLAACGGGHSRPKRAPQAVPNGHYGHPKKIQHASGETFVPGRARRVVVLTPGAADTTLALGVKPVGAAGRPSGGFPGYLAARLGGVRDLGPPYRLSLPRIRALHSELILGSQRRQGSLFEQLRVIAPTVMSPPPRIGPGTPRQWRLMSRLYAEALGRVDEGEAMLRRYDALAAGVRRRFGPGARRLRVAAIEALPSGARLAGLDSFAAAVLLDAGVRGARPRGISRALPPQRYARLPADLVLVSAVDGAERTLAGLRRGLRARTVVVPDELWWRGEGPLASAAALGELERLVRRPG
ncbi:MAG: hypothetical protein ABR581_11590 [Thermoleophilaceae bacterium]